MRCHACLSLEVLTDTAEVELASWEFAICIEIIHMSMFIDQAIFVGSFLLSNCMGLMIDTCRAHCRVHTYTADVKLEFAVYVYTCIYGYSGVYVKCHCGPYKMVVYQFAWAQ